MRGKRPAATKMDLQPPWAASLAATVFLAGCASLEPLDHPQDWVSSPGSGLPNGCPELSGTYAIRATGAYPPDSPASPPLDEVLGPGVLRDAKDRRHPWPALPAATSATFSASGDWLHVRFRDDGQREAALRFKRKGALGGFTDGSDAMYQCLALELGPAMGFDGSRQSNFSIPYLVAEDDMNFVFLSRARDGSLIVNYRTNRVLLTGALIGSHARWVGSTWWRYPPVVAKP